MDRRGDIKIFHNNTFLSIRKGKLYRFPYFRALFEADSKLEEITLLDNDFNEEIINIITEAKNPMKKAHDPDDEWNILKDILLHLASTFLGINTNIYLNYVRTGLLSAIYDEERGIALDYINELLQYNLMKHFADIYENMLSLTYKLDNRFEKVIESYYDERELNLIKKAIPYMKTFSRCFIICDTYNLDFNLITAKPLLRDMFLYQNTKHNLRTEKVCCIFAHYMRIVEKFLSYFDFVFINYGEEDTKTPQLYLIGGQFNIELQVDVGVDWYSREIINISDRAKEIPEEDLVTFYTNGNISVGELPIPVSDDIFTTHSFN